MAKSPKESSTAIQYHKNVIKNNAVNKLTLYKHSYTVEK